MKRYFLLIFAFACCLSHIAISQEFSFNMYFEDAIGNKDTLTFGYDPTGTENLDEHLGEINYAGQKMDSAFEIFITRDYELWKDEVTLLLKKQIAPQKTIDCQMPFVNLVLVKCKNYPLKIKYDKSIFNNNNLDYSFLTDWNSGAWFDATVGYEQGPFFLKEYDSLLLEYVGGYDWEILHGEENDTIREMFFTIADEGSFYSITGNCDGDTLGITLKEQIQFNATPNPVEDNLVLNFDKNYTLSELKLFDINGRLISSSKQTCINMSDMHKGYYLLYVKFKEFNKPVTETIIKY